MSYSLIFQTILSKLSISKLVVQTDHLSVSCVQLSPWLNCKQWRPYIIIFLIYLYNLKCYSKSKIRIFDAAVFVFSSHLPQPVLFFFDTLSLVSYETTLPFLLLPLCLFFLAPSWNYPLQLFHSHSIFILESFLGVYQMTPKPIPITSTSVPPFKLLLHGSSSNST